MTRLPLRSDRGAPGRSSRPAAPAGSRPTAPTAPTAPTTLTALAAFAALAALGPLATACSSSTPRTAGPSTAPPSSTTAITAPAPASTTVASTTSTTGKPACTARSVIRSWSLARRARQLIVVPVLDAGPGPVGVAVAQQAGGLLILGSVPPGPQLAADLGPAIRAHALVMVDQEGGGVQRLGSDVESIPWPRQMAATMTTAQVQAAASRLARQMAGLGVGVDLAPVLDLDGGPALTATDPDGPRSFSTDPSVAAAYGLAFARGLASGGVLAVAKHFPGLGESTGNTDYGPASTRPLSQLQGAGLVPFEKAVAGGVRAVMVANASVPGLTPKPASVAPEVVTGLLRDRLHFNGLVMTDSLSAGALRAAGYTVPSAAVAAIGAGADMVLFGSTLTPADTAALAPGPLSTETAAIADALTRAAGRGALPESRLDDAVLHVEQARGVDLCAGAGAPGGTGG